MARTWLVLGLAGIAGCMEREALEVPQAAASAPAAPAGDPQPLSQDEREAALNAIRLKRIAAAEQERAMREKAERDRQALQQTGGKCIDGRAFRKQGNEWQDVGTC